MGLGGGETGIRTLGTRKGSTVFETVLFDHSSTSPWVFTAHLGGNAGRGKTKCARCQNGSRCKTPLDDAEFNCRLE
jgi:hypothetical protein